MVFDRFTAYFNQPISTTQDRDTAMKFAGSSGIILTFRKGHNNNHSCRYLDVSWLSAFPEEKERLFYGQNVVFEISDIYEASTGKTYGDTLQRFNIFQNMVKNSDCDWLDIGENSPAILKLVQLISKQIANREEAVRIKYSNNKKQEKNRKRRRRKRIKWMMMMIASSTDSSDDDDDEKEMDYDEKLFNHFCNNQHNEWICIRQYTLIPLILRQSFITKKEEHKILDFIKIVKLFPFVQMVVMNELDICEMDEEIKHYEVSITEFIKFIKMNRSKYKQRISNLSQVILESKHGKWQD